MESNKRISFDPDPEAQWGLDMANKYEESINKLIEAFESKLHEVRYKI